MNNNVFFAEFCERRSGGTNETPIWDRNVSWGESPEISLISSVGRLSRPNPTANLVSVIGRGNRHKPTMVMNTMPEAAEGFLPFLRLFCCAKYWNELTSKVYLTRRGFRSCYYLREETKVEEDCILIAAPNQAGLNFVRLLLSKRRNVAVLVNNKTEEKRARKLGTVQVIRVKTEDEKTWRIPEFRIGRVFIFETTLTLTCRYLQLCRQWTSSPIIVITPERHPRMIYKGLGATYVIHSGSCEVGFLANGIPETGD